MTNPKNIGFILFLTSSVIVMASSSSVISSTAPVRNYLRNYVSSRLNTRSTKKFQYTYFSSTNTLSQNGTLITKTSPGFRNHGWKRLVSSMELEIEEKEIKSSSTAGEVDNDDKSCEIEVINDYGKVITICWISDQGKLYHYYPINDGSIRDGSVRNTHVEYTSPGHSFVALLMKPNGPAPKMIEDVDPHSIIFVYQPKCVKTRHSLRVVCKDSNEDIASIELTCQPIEPRELIDTTDKLYISKILAGFTFHCEPDVFECHDSLLETLTLDLEAVTSLLPPNVLLSLRKDTSFWLNTSICYGYKSNPVHAKSCTYHEKHGQEWLRRNGLSIKKAGCIEICSADDYLKTRGHWGIGGLILHELMHCVHDHYAIGGYDCEIIRNAYQKAMYEKLYEKVPVHGPQGVNGATVKAYACANCMEFFAELSVAYLWNVDSETEYNKWYPHNRSQLLAHDVNTLTSLNTFWTEVDHRLALLLSSSSSSSSDSI